MAKVNLTAINQTVVKAAQAMEFFKRIAEVMARAGHNISWVAPSGMVVHQTYFEPKTEVVNAFQGSTRVRMNVAIDSDTPKVSKHKSGIAPNVIHSLDASHLVLTALQCIDEGVDHLAFIHDSFGCHAGDMQDMNRILRETFIRMYSVNILEDFKAQLKEQIPEDVYKELPEVPQMGSLDLNQIKDSLYFFA